jgi:hypothetical protein
MPARRIEAPNRQESPKEPQRTSRRGMRVAALALVAVVGGGIAIHDHPSAVATLRHPQSTASPTLDPGAYYKGRPYIQSSIVDGLITKAAGSEGQLEVGEYSNGAIQASVLGTNNKKELTLDMRCTTDGHLQWYTARHPIPKVGVASVAGITLSPEVDVVLYTDKGDFGQLVCKDGSTSGQRTDNIIGQLDTIAKVPRLPEEHIHLPSALDTLLH